ncbi:MAG: glycosyltransferase [Cyclobacteriaceae bacterium]|nr:glycosyltransferase [Cyclobacteriaceae bacterium]
MKVLIISSCYPRPSNLNSGIFVHQQVKALQALGVECHVIQPVNWFPPFGLHRLHPYWKLGHAQLQDTFSSYENVTIHHPRIFIRMPSRFFKEHAWDVEGHGVADYILSHKELRSADILYAQFLIHEGYVGVIVKQRTGIRLVSIALGDDVHAWPEQKTEVIPFLKIVLEQSDLVLANSEALALDTVKWANDNQQLKVQTIYQGIDLEKFKPLSDGKTVGSLRLKFGLEPSISYLLCVARPVVLKGWLNLLDAIQLLGDQFNGWKLLMVAPPITTRDALRLDEEVEKRNIGGFVKYLGDVNHSDMPDLMRAIDLFVLPSYNEGLSNAVIEAMATGLPVIATDVGGHREFINSGKNGILIEPNNTVILAKVLEKVISHELFRNEIASHARAGAEYIGSYTQNAIKLTVAFVKLLKEPGNHQG